MKYSDMNLSAKIGQADSGTAIALQQDIITQLARIMTNTQPQEAFHTITRLLKLNTFGIYYLSPDKTLEEEFFESRKPEIDHDLNAQDLFLLIKAENKSLMIEPDLFIIPLRYENNISGIMVAARDTGVNIPYFPDLLEMIGIHLGCYFQNRRRLLELEATNGDLLLAKRDLEEILLLEVSHLVDHEKKLEETQAQLIRSERFCALGKLVAGVAHEIKNPLTALRGFTDMLISYYDKNKMDKTLHPIIDGLQISMAHMEAVISSYLAFSRNNEIKHIRLSLADVLTKTQSIIKQYLTIKKIKLTINTSENLPAISGNINQLVQIFINLIINAEQAIIGREGKIDINAYALNNFLVVTVSDNGIGIKAQHLNRIFDSFFTTKGLENSSGLGLAVTKHIMEEHQGHIDVTSQEMIGTQFTLRFPVAA